MASKPRRRPQEALYLPVISLTFSGLFHLSRPFPALLRPLLEVELDVLQNLNQVLGLPHLFDAVGVVWRLEDVSFGEHVLNL